MDALEDERIALESILDHDFETVEPRQWALYIPVKRLLSPEADDLDPLRLRVLFFLPDSYPDGEEPPVIAFDEEVAAEIRRKVHFRFHNTGSPYLYSYR